MRHARDAAKELLEMPCGPDVVHESSIATVRNYLWYIHLYVKSECVQYVHEMCESIRIAYFFPVRNVYILSKRVRTVVLEDRRGSAMIELRESTRLKWSQS
jgi:hypothetical protein